MIQRKRNSFSIIFFLIKESFIYAISSLIVNKLRTILSLLGITIGIFAIISVKTAIDSLEDNIRESISQLGDNIVYCAKWPWSFESDYPWWEYMKRPVPNIDEVDEILKRSTLAQAACFSISSQVTVQYGDNYLDEITVVANSHNYEEIRNFEIVNGRYFSLYERDNGKNKAVLGYTIAELLFQGTDPSGKEIKIDNYKFTVIGVFKKEGEDMFGMSQDEQVHIPINYAKNIWNIKDDALDPMIMIKAKENITVDELIDELQGIMRAIRRLKPVEDDDFALNKTSMITEGFKSVFSIIDAVGWIIGLFSIIVGGFGIANIMFVSVKEQTKLIGIQKAIGAKRYFILLQFLFEAIVLSLIGGLLGLILIFLLTLLVNSLTDFSFTMSIKNILVGLVISITVGLISGIVPAYNASRLNPVDAMNTV